MLIPITLSVYWHQTVKCVIKIGFIPITIYPKKPKKKKAKKSEEKQKTEEKKKDKEKSNPVKENGLPWLIDLIKRIAELAKGVLKDFFGHIIIKRLMFSVRIAGSDAADTAVKYGYCCSAIYPAFGIIVGSVKCKDYGVDIAPNFEENATTEIMLDLKAKIIVLWLVALVFRHGIKGIKLLLDLNKRGE